MRRIIMILFVTGLLNTGVYAQEYVQTTTNTTYANKSFSTTGKFSIGPSDTESVGGSPLNIQKTWGNWMALVDGYKKDVYAFHNPNQGGRMELFIHDGVTDTNKFGVFTIRRDGNIGIGTTAPISKLHVAGNITNTGQITTYNPNNPGASVALSWQNDIARIRVGGINAGASNGFHFQGPGDRSLLRMLGNGNVGIGTTTPDARLAVNGDIHTQEVRVDLIGWADYVFENDYKLPTLQQVEDHINQNGHLINIPSAAEVEANGIKLGEMNTKLLEKIEELTLYAIAQEKQLKEQKVVNNQQVTKNQQLEARLAKLEALLNKQ